MSCERRVPTREGELRSAIPGGRFPPAPRHLQGAVHPLADGVVEGLDVGGGQVAPYPSAGPLPPSQAVRLPSRALLRGRRHAALRAPAPPRPAVPSAGTLRGGTAACWDRVLPARGRVSHRSLIARVPQCTNSLCRVPRCSRLPAAVPLGAGVSQQNIPLHHVHLCRVPQHPCPSVPTSPWATSFTAGIPQCPSPLPVCQKPALPHSPMSVARTQISRRCLSLRSRPAAGSPCTNTTIRPPNHPPESPQVFGTWPSRVAFISLL